MALNKLFQQFSGGARDASKQAGEMLSASEVDAETLRTATDPVAESRTTDGSAPAPSRKLNPVERGILEEEVIETLRTCYDPEIPVNIYDMGLIYEIDVDQEAFVDIKMTLTSPGCPVAGTLPPEVERKAASVEGVSGAHVELVWDPQWTMEMMSEEARLELGFF